MGVWDAAGRRKERSGDFETYIRDLIGNFLVESFVMTFDISRQAKSALVSENQYDSLING